jgi:hypothetical protein
MTTKNDENQKAIDARALTLPIITMISIIGFVIWITYIGTQEITAGRNKLSSIENTLIELKDEIKNIKSASKGPDRGLTATDMAIFCLRAQILNKEWRCPSVNHSYDSLNQLNDSDILREIQRLNRQEGSRSPLDKDLSLPPPQPKT